MPTHDVSEIPVVAAIIRNSRNQILLAQRSEPAELRGLWEFPGGKIEDGESEEQALLREIDEEIGIAITIEEKLGDFPCFGGRHQILLHVWTAIALSDKTEARVHLDVRWVDLADIGKYPLTPADRPVFQAYLALN